MAIEQLTPPEHITHDMRERLSETLGRIIVASDIVDALPLDFALGVYRTVGAAQPAVRRLNPIVPDRVSAQTVPAIVVRGAWIVKCPFCPGGEYADPAQPLFLCCSCWNQDAGGRPLHVVWPDDAVVVETLLLERPHGKHRHWEPSMGRVELDADYLDLQVAGTPTDQLTGDLITAAIYNARVGASGDSHQLWVHHDHATAVGAGDGAYLGAVACLAAGIYPLGQKLGAGRRIEVKLSAELTAAAGGSTTATLTWDTAFGTACEMVLMTVVQSSGDTTYFYGCQVDSMSTTNCVVRLFGGFGTKVAKIVAVGIGY